MRFTEQAKYVTITHEYEQHLVFAMNNKKFMSLLDDLRKILVDAANAAGEFGTKLVYEAAEDGIQKILSEHGAVLIRVSLKPWQKAAREFHKEIENEGRVPKGLVERIQQIQ